MSALEGQVALVTGAAGGIGRAVVSALARRQRRLTMTIHGVPRPHRILPAQLRVARSLALTRSRRSTGS